MSDQLDSSDHARVGDSPEPGKRIALIYWAAEGDGVASHLADYSRNLVKRGHEVTWFMGTRDTKMEIPHVKMVYSELLDLDAPAPRPDDVRRWFAGHAADSDFYAVHLHNAHAPFRPEVAEGLIQLRDQIRNDKSAPPLTLVHTYHSPFTGPEADRAATVVNPVPGIAVSDWMRAWAEEKGASVETSRLGVDLARYANVPDLKITAGEPVTFGVAGRMAPNKGIREVYDAYARVLDRWDERKDGPRPRLLIASPAQSVGMEYEKADGYKQELQAKIEAAGHADSVRFMNATHQNMPRVFGQADLWISWSQKEEALGLVPMEAQASGRPAVVSDVGGLPETVEPDSGSMVPIPSHHDPGNPQTVSVEPLVAIMTAVAKNPKILEEKGANARKYARRTLGADQQVSHTVKIYEKARKAEEQHAKYGKRRSSRTAFQPGDQGRERPHHIPAPQHVAGAGHTTPSRLSRAPGPYPAYDSRGRGLQRSK